MSRSDVVSEREENGMAHCEGCNQKVVLVAVIHYADEEGYDERVCEPCADVAAEEGYGVNYDDGRAANQ